MNKLKEVRFFKGMTQWRLGKLTRINQTKISLFENDLVEFSEEEKRRVAEALGMTPEDIFSDRPIPTVAGNKGR